MSHRRTLALYLLLVFGFPFGRASAGVIRIQAEAQSFQRFHAPGTSKGLVLYLPGLGQSPEIFSSDARLRFRQGYDVLALRLPGHGQLNADGTANLTGLPATADEYDRFAEKVYRRVRGFSNVKMVGLSTGANLALRILELHGHDTNAAGQLRFQIPGAVNPGLEGALAFRLGSRIVRLPLPELGLRLNRLTGGRLADFLAPFFREIPIFGRSAAAPRGHEVAGLRTIPLQNLMASGYLGQRVKEQGALLSGLPIQYLVSDADTIANPSATKRLARQTGGHVFAFPTRDGLPHAMVGAASNPNRAARRTIARVISGALEGRYHSRP